MKNIISFLLMSTSNAVILKGNCNLKELGLKFQVDKFDGGHMYEDLYCDTFEPIKDKEITMLEIGFGCGHHVHGASARLWTNYFKNLKYYGIDYYAFRDKTRDNQTFACVQDWLKSNPGIVQKLYYGNQANITFLNKDEC